MKVRLHAEMWVYEQEGDMWMSRPWYTDMKTGKSLPKLAAVPVRVLPAGSVVEIGDDA